MADAQHRCPWPGCTAEVGSGLWGCIEHWRRLPLPARKLISGRAAEHRIHRSLDSLRGLRWAHERAVAWIREEGIGVGHDAAPER